MASLSLAEERKRRQLKWLQKLKKLDMVEKCFKQFPLIPEYSPRLTDPSPFWHSFPRQKQAFDFAASHPEEVHIFAFEKDGITTPASEKTPTGFRRYLATNYPQLWHVIRSFAALNKHATFYEVIPEGAACKLYFDLEFNKEVNPERNGDEMMKVFIEFVCKQIKQVFKLNCSQRHVIDLDASTDAKFSRHLVFNLPKQAVFKDNINAGNFVNHICAQIHKQIEQHLEADSNGKDDETPTKKQKLDGEGGTSKAVEETAPPQGDLHSLLVKDKHGDDGLFIDTGVYTRNRNFRLYQCSKLGKANPLKVASTNCYKPRLDKRLPWSETREEYQMFLDSIITNVRFSQDIHVLTYEDDSSNPTKSTHNKRLSADDKTKPDIHVLTYEDDSSNPTKSTHNKRLSADDKTKPESSPTDEPLEGSEHSPYPDIDSFIRSCVTEGGIQGEVRRWLYFTQGQMLIYDITKNRWCGRINRQHKSNNIMILVDLKRGVYYQKCHDPDCKAANYKSQEHPIPPDCLPAFFDEFDDDELLVATEQAEQMRSKGEDVGAAEKMSADRTLDAAGWEEDGELNITDEEMLAAVSALEDSGIEN